MDACKAVIAIVTLLVTSVFCSRRFFITPMRSSKDCFICVICVCSCVISVCSSMMSRLAPKAGTMETTKNARDNARGKRTRFYFIVTLLDVKNAYGDGEPGVTARQLLHFGSIGRARRPSLHYVAIFRRRSVRGDFAASSFRSIRYRMAFLFRS